MKETMKKNIIAASFSLIALTSCLENGEFENKLFYDAVSTKYEVRVATDEKVEQMTVNFSVGMAMPLENDLHVKFVESPELLDTFREAYYLPDTELLPEGHCDIEALSATIKAGAVSSGKIALDFTNLGVDELDYDKTYVLPVTLKADGVELLDRSKTMYFVVKEASLVNVAANLSANYAYPEWGEFDEVADMSAFTFEALICPQNFTANAEINTLMGIEDNFLLRYGDAGLDPNQLQVAFAIYDSENKRFRNNYSSPILQVKADRWYHVAVTFDGTAGSAEGADLKVYYDGKLKIAEKCVGTGDDGTVAINSRNFKVAHSNEMDGKPRCFWIGYSYDDKRPFNGLISEVRVWKKALTEEEINAPSHFYKLYPDPETGEFPAELVAYWKFDDAEGDTAKDYSIYGNDLKGKQDFLWYSVELPQK